MNSQPEHPQSQPESAAPGVHPHDWLSALADGDVQAANPACAGWREDEKARQTWHVYHLIGDVMRSDELASTATRDAAFLRGVRQRLAAEPAVLAPVPALPMTGVPARRRQPWLVPVAAAAGFAVVAGVLVVTRIGQPGGMPGAPPATALASASGPAGILANGSRMVSTAPGQPAPARTRQPAGPLVPASTPGDPGLLRDAGLDDYLRAHQAARGGVAVAAPAAPLRRVDVVVPARAER